MPHYLLIRETASTNTYLKTLAATLLDATVVYTHHQTAGRGQKGNSWESEPGKNLTFSMLIKRPQVAVRDQFAISEAVSLAIADVMKETLSGEHPEIACQVKVKWPNDIYVGDRKLCGILIENSLDKDGIAYSVIGIGVNVNQSVFVSDAPNPVSLCQLTGHEYDLEKILHSVCERIEQICGHFNDFAQRQALHEEYVLTLYRADGQPYIFATPNGTKFAATIQSVEPDGMLILCHDDATIHSYAFKQVKHVINDIEL
ncbi:MAG: biotin--[acetyl-CoA-carboxylase] ligase [Muribaculaceae bacterium]|nr:biotin--[acetyl-CoA-carboxylase] ligase [Muribaculaceae bacterium]